MEGKKIEPTRKTPEVYLGPEGVIKIWGRSVSEDSRAFYDTIGLWIDEYILDPEDITTVEFSLEYVNSASSKQIIKLLRKLLLVTLKHKLLKVNWYYEEGDSDILEKGEYFSSAVKLKFTYIETGGLT